MPHLSPMYWIIMLIALWSALFTISINQWWNQSAQFPKNRIHNSSSSNSWKW